MGSRRSPHAKCRKSADRSRRMPRFACAETLSYLTDAAVKPSRKETLRLKRREIFCLLLVLAQDDSKLAPSLAVRASLASPAHPSKVLARLTIVQAPPWHLWFAWLPLEALLVANFAPSLAGLFVWGVGFGRSPFFLCAYSASPRHRSPRRRDERVYSTEKIFPGDTGGEVVGQPYPPAFYLCWKPT